MEKKRSLLLGVLILTGCASVPHGTFELPASTIEDRMLQSRVFATTNEASLLNASASVLQDLGYVIEEVSAGLGLLTASKMVSAVDGGQIAWAMLAAVFGVPAAIDDRQKVNVCLVIHPRQEAPGASVARITVQRTVFDVSGTVNRIETLREPTLYQEFFDKLTRASFLEGQSL